MIQWIESCGDQGKKVITTSQSLKHVYMLPGRHFFMDEEYAEELPENIFSKQEQSGPEMAEKIPVSYTHLDVYKRQEVSLALSCAILKSGLSIISIWIF